MMEILQNEMVYVALGAVGACVSYYFLKNELGKGLFSVNVAEIEKMAANQQQQYYTKRNEEDAELRREIDLTLHELEHHRPVLENYLKAKNDDQLTAHVRQLLNKVETMK